jgi:hypothetical protein
MNKKSINQFNEDAVIKYSRCLQKRIGNCKSILTRKIHEDVINLCTVVLRDNPYIYKKINRDFIKVPKPVHIGIKNYHTNKTEMHVIKDHSELESLAKEETIVLNRIIEIYSLQKKLHKPQHLS